MDKLKNGFVFPSTGRVIYVNDHLIAISPDLITYAVRDDIYGDFDYYEGTRYLRDLTKSEAIELADYMINIWGEFKNKYMTKPLL